MSSHINSYSLVFACPECGERLLVEIPDDGTRPEVLRMRDIPHEDLLDSEGDATDNSSSDDMAMPRSKPEKPEE